MHLMSRDNGSLLDGSECLEVWKSLSENAGSNSNLQSLNFFFTYFDSEGESMYHGVIRRQCAEELYKAGFHHCDQTDLRGNSPIGSLAIPKYDSNPRQMIEILQWHVSKGANLHRRLPWTNEPVSYLIAVKIIRQITMNGFPSNHSKHFGQIEEYLKDFTTLDRALFLAQNGIAYNRISQSP